MMRKLPLLFVTFLVIVCTVQSLTHKGKPKKNRKHFVYNETELGWWFPDPHNESGLIEALMERNPKISTRAEYYYCTDVCYYMYTGYNLYNPHFIRDQWDLNYYSQYFGPDTKCVMLMHGFGGDWTSNPNTPEMLHALHFYYGEDVVILVCDWGPMAAAPWYLTAAESTDTVGWCNALMLKYMKDYLSTNLWVHLIGFSLGAHCAGNTGYWLKYWGSIYTPDCLTGLDSAGPEISTWHTDWRLDPTDAYFVEGIHTCAGYLGTWEPYGHVDFYPDGGTPTHATCSYWSDAAMAFSCSHSAVCPTYAQSLRRQSLQRNYYTAYPCDSLQAVEDETCQWGEPYQMRFQSDLPHGLYYAYP